MTTKDAYRQKMKASLKELSAQIDLLAAKAENVGADARLKYAQNLDKLRDKQNQAVEKMKELEAANGDDAWDKIKDTADNLWDDLKAGVTNTVAKFK